MQKKKPATSHLTDDSQENPQQDSGMTTSLKLSI